MEEDTAAHTEALLTNVSSLEYAVSGDQVPVRVIDVRISHFKYRSMIDDHSEPPLEAT